MISLGKKKIKPSESGQGHITSHRRNYGKGSTERKALTQGAPGPNHPWICSWERKSFLGLCIIIWRSSPSKSATLGQRGLESRNRGLLLCFCPWRQQWAGGVKIQTVVITISGCIYPTSTGLSCSVSLGASLAETLL